MDLASTQIHSGATIDQVDVVAEVLDRFPAVNIHRYLNVDIQRHTPSCFTFL